MLLLSMKMYLALLWGISALFSTQSMSISTPATSSIPSASTTKLLIGEDVVHTETTAWHKTDKPAEVSAAAETTATPTAETEEVNVTYRSNSSNDMTTTLVAMNTVATTASNSASQQLHTSAAVSTAAGEAQRSSDTTISETVKPAKDPLHQHTSATFIDVTPSVTTFAASSATDSVSSPQPTSTNEPEVASSLSSTPSPADSVPTSASTSTMTVNPTSEAAIVSDTPNSSSSKSETTTTSTELSSTPQPASMTTSSISSSDAVGASSTTEASTILASTGSTAESSTNLASTGSTAESSTISFTIDSANSTTAAVSNSTTGVFIPRVPKRLPIPTTKSAPPVPRETSLSPPRTDVQPCSTRGLVTQSLIAIACLAALATIFMVTTIILCAKLSSRKYRVKKPQQATEMMCISALLPESDYSYARRRNPVPNGILVMHHGGDSDEDGGDNLTLSSFLPENDRYV
ncbi:P-selectin glycoprotein ligand 1 isoform X2 [Sparus aurata]|nr:P-selectin glycoprotein ligand 1 isoform X2 [Sparus aurata]XP_030292087.1 P-selectin glycoprotein ligand 1 isoform X2 [Sparus aurata]XP_030292089.1 P-selectin glycoprotein ligand 1 isoform X2 [Sparus aurata]